MPKEQSEPSTICEHGPIAHPEEDERLQLQFLLPVKVSINDHFKPSVSSRTDGLGIITLKGSSQCLHLLDKAAERRFFEVVLQVEGTADARVSDHWAEDLRTVDLLALPPVYCIVQSNSYNNYGNYYPTLDYLHCLSI